MARRDDRLFQSAPLAVALAICGFFAAGALWIYLQIMPPPKNELFCKVLGQGEVAGREIVRAVGVTGLGLMPREALVQKIIEGEKFHTRRAYRMDTVILWSGAKACYIKTQGDGVTPNNILSLPDCPASLKLNENLKRHEGPCPSP